MDVSKNRGKHPKMDGENNGSKPYEQMDDLGGFPPIFGNTHIYSTLLAFLFHRMTSIPRPHPRFELQRDVFDTTFVEIIWQQNPL